jgi:putative ABC transport system permease protein
MERVLSNFYLAIDGIIANKLRAFLTALGIIFGVAAVVAMLAIGSGAQKAILEQMKLIGSNSIIVTSLTEDDTEEGEENEDEKNRWSPGLSINDVKAINEIVPTIERSGGELSMKESLIANGKQSKVKVLGIEESYFNLNNLTIGIGKNFSESHHINGTSVCIIGKTLHSKYFQGDNAIGEKIKVGNNWMTIVGITDKQIAKRENLEKLGLQDNNSNVYIPIKTALIRFNDRAKVTGDDIASRSRSFTGSQNYHQLDRAVFRIDDSKNLQASAEVIGKYLDRKHNSIKDYEIQIPELLIQQQQKTQETFNVVLAVIAGISLLVGGIGIMNIMLASVLERIREIGIRRSIGAQKKDIILQFLFEAVFICFLGGLAGVILGIVTAKLIAQSAEIPTVISWWSIVLSFGVAFMVGLVFGLFPAKKASEYDPIIALRSN